MRISPPLYPNRPHPFEYIQVNLTKKILVYLSNGDILGGYVTYKDEQFFHMTEIIKFREHVDHTLATDKVILLYEKLGTIGDLDLPYASVLNAKDYPKKYRISQ